MGSVMAKKSRKQKTLKVNMLTTTDKSTREQARQARHMRKAIKQLAVKRDRDCGGMIVRSSAPHENRKAYKRNRVKQAWRKEIE